MKLQALALAALTVLFTGAAQADTYTFSGSLTTADPTFNRPFSLVALSGSGTAVRYDAANLVGITPGDYTFSMVSSAFDTFLALYAGSFNPASPLSNLVALNDDLGLGSNSGFDFTLVAGTSYTLVSTAFSNSGLGAYTTTIATAIPEPGSYALMALGLVLVGTALRRRQA